MIKFVRREKRPETLCYSGPFGLEMRVYPDGQEKSFFSHQIFLAKIDEAVPMGYGPTVEEALRNWVADARKCQKAMADKIAQVEDMLKKCAAP